jgi:hypothetical protein
MAALSSDPAGVLQNLIVNRTFQRRIGMDDYQCRKPIAEDRLAAVLLDANEGAKSLKNT